MVVLTLIGVAATYTSVFEIKISGNKRAMTDCFYTADSGIQGTLAAIGNFNLPGYTLVTNPAQIPPDLSSEPIDRFLTPTTLSLPAGVTFTQDPQVIIYHTTLSGSPRGTHLSATGGYEFAYFVVDSVGCDQLDVLLRSRCEHRQKLVRLLPTMQGGS
jgi:hypothetical protein